MKYNGKDIFSRNWELCSLDEDYGDERIIYCPFNPGDLSFVKDRPIPFYIPKVNVCRWLQLAELCMVVYACVQYLDSRKYGIRDVPNFSHHREYCLYTPTYLGVWHDMILEIVVNQ